MSTDDECKRFADYLRLHVRYSKLLGVEQESELLCAALAEFDLKLGEARAVLMTVASSEGLIIERVQFERMRDYLAQSVTPNGKLAKKHFEDGMFVGRTLFGGKLSDQEIRRRLKRLAETNSWRPKRAGLFRSRRWYDSIEA